MCEKCETAAANAPADVVEGMALQADLLIRLFKTAADMNFRELAGGELFQLTVYIAAKALAESLHATFGEGRRQLAARLEAEVLPKYLAMAKCFAEREAAARPTQSPGRA